MDKRFIVRQNDIRDCGVCSLESIIKYYGGFIPLETLRLDTKTNNNGTTAFNLIKTAKKYGFSAYGTKEAKLDDNLILPAIAHVVTKKGLNHFVVIYKITKKHIIIMDPAKGYVKVQKEDFIKEWTNVILIFKPFQKIPLLKIHNDLKTFFINILSKEKKLISKILINNIIITILTLVLSYYFKIVMELLDTKSFNFILLIILVFFLFHLMKFYFNHVKNELAIYLNKNIDLLVIPEFINHVFNIPLNVIASRTSGEIITRIKDLANIKALFSDIFEVIILNLFLSICSCIVLKNISDELFFILCILALIYTVVGIASSPVILRKINDNIDLETDFNSLISEKVSSLETIKNISMTKSVINSLTNSYTSLVENSLTYSKFINGLATVKTIINDLGLFLISSYGLYLINKGQLSLISLITFNTILTYFIEPIEDCIDIIPKFNLIKLSSSKISEFLNIEPEKIGKVSSFSNGTIIFKNVSYSYNDYEDVVKNFSLTINKGEHLLIKGPSGSGKSTIMQMINRNLDDYQGNITIDGINIKDYSLNTLRKNILYVSQREKIFNDTILNNIVLDKKVPLKELNEVLRITKVDEIISKKSLRLQSVLYDEGFNLSGGQRQRIILARALLLKPQILILDETLSEIDRKSEFQILKALDKKYQDMTIIYISHTNTLGFTKSITLLPHQNENNYNQFKNNNYKIERNENNGSKNYTVK